MRKIGESERVKGVGAILASVFFSSLYGIFSRYIGLSFGVFSQNWIRNLIVVLVLALYFIITKQKWKKFRREDLVWLFGLLMLGWFQNILYFLVFNHLSIGTVYFLFYTTMIITGYLSGKILFGEKINIIKVIAIIMAITGLVLTYPVGLESGKNIYIFMTLFVGAATTLWYVFSKKISDHYHSFQLVQIDAFTTFMTSFIGAIFIREAFPISSSGFSWLMVFLYAAAQIAGLFLAIYAFKKLEVQITSAIMPMELVFALVMGFILFKETLSVQSIIGALFIIGAAVLPSVYTIKKRS